MYETAFNATPTPNLFQVNEHCNVGRDYPSIDDQGSFESLVRTVLFHGDTMKGVMELEMAGPNQWTQPDQLIVGHPFSLTGDQEQLHMGLWAMMASPLFMSADIRNIGRTSRSVLQNKLLLSIDQDPLGVPGRMVYMRCNVSVWLRFLSGRRFAVAAADLGSLKTFQQ